MTPLAEFLVAEIGLRGPLTFAEYMDLALYHPEHGYYAADGPRTGRAGDFMTSPEIDDAFGELWTRAFREVWETMDRPGQFHVVEMGPGEGAFARAVFAAAEGDFKDALHYVLVEPRRAGRSRQQAALAEHRCDWADSIADVRVENGCVFANEVLDNQPVHLLRPDADGLRETYVSAGATGLEFVEGPPSSAALAAYVESVGLDPDGGPMQVGVAAAELARAAAQSLRRGAIFFVDYGLEASEIRDRGGNTVVTYSDRGAGSDPLAAPGRTDITAHVDWTGIRLALTGADTAVSGPLLQAHVLRSLGLGEVDDRLRARHDRALADGDGASAVRMLSRRNALGALANTSGLGGLQVLTGTKNAEKPAL